jgi:hypothetical protein
MVCPIIRKQSQRVRARRKSYVGETGKSTKAVYYPDFFRSFVITCRSARLIRVW